MKIETSKRITLLILVISVSFFILAPLLVSAAGLVPCGLSENDPETPWDDTVDCDLCSFLWLIKNVMDLILKLGGTICFLVVVAGAIVFLIAGGSTNLLATGKKIFTSAIIGLAIILCSWLIISAVFGATGYNAAQDWYKFECEGPAPPPPPPPPSHLVCQNGSCVEVEGEEDDECSSDIECRPVWTCQSAGQRYATCLPKKECDDACEIYQNIPGIIWPECEKDIEYCQEGPRTYDCFPIDMMPNGQCDTLLSGLEDAEGDPNCPTCAIGEKCCFGTEEKINEAKCKVQCFPDGYDYNPQTGECTCITEYHLECKQKPRLSPDEPVSFSCQRVIGPDPNPSENPCATKNEGDDCILPEEEKPCDKCGEGALNICDVSECHALLGTGGNGCHFEDGLIPHYCWECIGGNHPVNSCSDYLSRESCEFDACSIDGCSWEGGSCVETIVDPFDGYTLQVDERQKDHASQALMDLLACMKDKLPDEAREISSISDDGILSEPPTCDYLNCSGNVCGECSGCVHVCNSCHYGGKNCNTQERFSYAVDFAKEGYCDEIKTAALECNADAFVNYEVDHVHVSLNKTSGCECNEPETGEPCP